MIAVILAAGMATRLRPLTEDRPKCLLEIGKKSLLQRTVDNILENGISTIVVVTGYRGEMIRKFLTGKYKDVCFHFVDNKDYQTTNNIYSLWLTRPYVEGKDFILLDSDILFDGRIISRLMNRTDTTLAVNSHELGEEEIKIIPDGKGKVEQISKTYSIEKSIGESVGREKMNADYSAALFKELATMIEDEGLKGVFYELAFERLIPRGYKLGITDTTDLFSIELDTVDDFNSAEELVPPVLI